MKNPKVTNLYVRNFPIDLFRRLKVKAAQEGRTLKEVCIELLSKGVK
jgi:plasmid stability protein